MANETVFPLRSPGAQQVRAAREAAGLSQIAAAHLCLLSAQPRWAEYENGERNIDDARWQLFLLLTNLHPTLRVAKRKKAAQS